MLDSLVLEVDKLKHTEVWNSLNTSSSLRGHDQASPIEITTLSGAQSTSSNFVNNSERPSCNANSELKYASSGLKGYDQVCENIHT